MIPQAFLAMLIINTATWGDYHPLKIPMIDQKACDAAALNLASDSSPSWQFICIDQTTGKITDTHGFKK